MMMEINYDLQKVIGNNCPNKFLLSINNCMICFVNSKNAAKPIIEYAVSGESPQLKNTKIKRLIDKVLNR